VENPLKSGFFENRDAENFENLIEAHVESSCFWQWPLGGKPQGRPTLASSRRSRRCRRSLDAQVLFDPAKEQFDLPTYPIELGDGQGKQGKIVGQEGQPQVLLGIVVGDAAQQIGIALRRADAGEANALVAAHAAGTIDRARGAQ